MTRYLIAATLCLSIYAAWLTGYAYPYIKRDVTQYTIVKLETAANSLKQPVKVADDSEQVDDGKLAHAPALPPKTSMAALKNVWPTHEQDELTIAQILEGSAK